MPFMKVGDLRRAIDGVSDELEIVVRSSGEFDDGDVDLCGGLVSARLEESHGDDEAVFLALDACENLDEPSTPAPEGPKS